jgi:hypothetical protein
VGDFGLEGFPSSDLVFFGLVFEGFVFLLGFVFAGWGIDRGQL